MRPKRTMLAAAASAAIATWLSGCTIPKALDAPPPSPTAPTGYLAAGATTTNDVAIRDERPTTLEALRSAKALLDSEREERQRVEHELGEEKKRTSGLEKDVARLTTEVETSRKSLDDARTSINEMARRLLQARLDRIKLEQELVKQQIASVDQPPSRDGRP